MPRSKTTRPKTVGFSGERMGPWVVPTDPPANLTALWVWTGEFIGACTRGSVSCPQRGNQTDDMEIRCGDYVLAVGYDRKYWGKQFDLFAGKVRNIGANMVWSTTTYSQEEIDAIPNIGIFIKQRWALGDALVVLPNYDTRILPGSGVIGESIFWMINANIHTVLNAR